MPIIRSPVKRRGTPIIPPAGQPKPYRAPAVNFDGKTVLSSVIRGPLPTFFSFAGWFKSIWYGKNLGGTTAAQYAWIVDPLGNFTPRFGGLFNQGPGISGNHWVSLGVSPPQGICTLGNTVADLGDPNNELAGTIRSLAGRGNVSCNFPPAGNPNFEDQLIGATDPDNNTEILFDSNGEQITQQTNAAPATPGSWQHIMGTIELDTGTAVMAFGDSQISLILGAGTANPIDGKAIYVGGDNATPHPNNYIGDMSDLFIYPQLSFIINGAISQQTRRFFVDKNGAPVDPLGTSGALQGIRTASGTSFPSILLHGDRNTFPLNAQGFSNTAFSIIAGALTNSLTSPSDQFA